MCKINITFLIFHHKYPSLMVLYCLIVCFDLSTTCQMCGKITRHAEVQQAPPQLGMVTSAFGMGWFSQELLDATVVLATGATGWY